MSDPGDALLAIRDAIATLGQVHHDPFGIGESVLRVGIIARPPFDPQSGIKVLQIALDLQNVVDLKAEMVDARLLVDLARRGASLHEADAEVPVRQVDGARGTA